MVLPLYPTLVVGFITLVVWYVVTRGQQRKRYPPGPYPLPLIGNLRDIIGSKGWLYFNKLREEHGDVFTIFMATKPMIVLSSVDAVREAFVTKQNDFAGRLQTFSLTTMVKNSDIISGQFGPIWKQQRKIAHSAIRTFASGTYLPQLIQQSFEVGSDELEKLASSGKKFNPKHYMDMTIYNIVASMVYGKTFKYNDPALRNLIDLMDELNDVFGKGVPADLFPVLKHLPLYSHRTIRKCGKIFANLTEEIYEEHKQNFDEDNPRDIVDHFLKSVKNVEQEEGKEATKGLTVLHYQMLIADVFLAGTDTTRTALLWCILHLAAFPECQKKLQEEVDRVIGPQTLVSSDHHSKLPYTDAFLHEVLRMKPNAPIGMPRLTLCDTSVGGYSIPVGMLVIPNILALHMNKDVWGDPEAFRPERFLDNNGKMGPHISSWMPFSTGRRVCLGESLAKVELQLVLATFMQRYEFSAPPGVQIDLRPKDAIQLLMPSDDNELIIKQRL